MSTLKKFYERHHDPTMWLFADLCLILCHSQAINRLSNSQKDCLWKQRTHYILENGTLHKQIPKEMKYNLHYKPRTFQFSYFPESLFGLVSMVGEAYFSNIYSTK